MTTKVEGFDRLVEPFRTELLAYCYRMLGSAHDAEDLVQDTYLRAWRAREQYDETRSSLRTWLYRIATNACLTALEVRGRRPLPSGLVAALIPLEPLVRGENVAWLQPLPDSLLDAGDPARAVIDRSSLRLAFAAALQHLSARQRGALILRDVLGFSASEAAEILGTTVVSVNSSVQRARTRVKEVGVRQERLSEPSAAEQRAWVDRYMKAFEHADVEGLKRLLTEDVLMEMPPMLNWFAGPGNYGLFMEWVFGQAGTDWCLKAVAANGQPGFAAYRRVGGGYELHTLQIFTVTAEGISRNSVFQDSEVFASFGLAAGLDAQDLATPGLVFSQVRGMTVQVAAGHGGDPWHYGRLLRRIWLLLVAVPVYRAARWAARIRCRVRRVGGWSGPAPNEPKPNSKPSAPTGTNTQPEIHAGYPGTSHFRTSKPGSIDYRTTLTAEPGYRYGPEITPFTTDRYDT